MKCLNRGCIAFVLVSVTAVTAYADDPPATPAPASTEAEAAPAEAPAPAPAAAAPAPRKFAGARTSRYVSGGVADSPFLTVGMTFPPGVSVAVGLNITYDGNGLVIPGMAMRSADKFAFSGLVYGSYYIYNVHPVGIATELAVIAPLAPDAFDPAVVVRPGVVFYYAPFAAPVVIGSSLSLSITVPKDDNAKASVQTLTPGVRLIYVF
jgi:hypothetical protein